MNIYKIIEEKVIKVEMVSIQCQCGTPMKIAKSVIEKDEAFHCPNCRKIGFVSK